MGFVPLFILMFGLKLVHKIVSFLDNHRQDMLFRFHGIHFLVESLTSQIVNSWLFVFFPPPMNGVI